MANDKKPKTTPPGGGDPAKNDPAAPSGAAKKYGDDPSNKTKKDAKKEELTEEDQKLKEELELLVTRACDSDLGVAKLALDTMADKLKTASATMASVPKPLKFLRPSYPVLQAYYEGPGKNKLLARKEVRELFADILSRSRLRTRCGVDGVVGCYGLSE